MLYRARVVEVKSAVRASVVIPRLYRDSVVGPIQSRVEVSVGDRVIVADLAPEAKVHDWVILGFESEVGRWYLAGPHEHPMGQVVGLVDALGGKATAPGPWAYPTVHSALVADPSPAGRLCYRLTPSGVQLRGRVRATSDLPTDTVLTTLPNGFRPSVRTMFQVSAMGPAPDYLATNFQAELFGDGRVMTRQQWLGEGTYSFNSTVPV